MSHVESCFWGVQQNIRKVKSCQVLCQGFRESCLKSSSVELTSQILMFQLTLNKNKTIVGFLLWVSSPHSPQHPPSVQNVWEESQDRFSYQHLVMLQTLNNQNQFPSFVFEHLVSPMCEFAVTCSCSSNSHTNKQSCVYSTLPWCSATAVCSLHIADISQTATFIFKSVKHSSWEHFEKTPFNNSALVTNKLGYKNW